MSTAKPTPGEWATTDFRVFSRRDGVTTDIGGAWCGEAVPYPEARANARLFAASKDMLAELEFAYAYLSKEPGCIAWKEGLGRMARVIKKAKGEA
jgi:hypothetical protein